MAAKTPPRRRRYKAVGFGDAYEPKSVDGHRDAVRGAADLRQYKETITSLPPATALNNVELLSLLRLLLHRG